MDVLFNPDPDTVLADPRPALIYVHVGKCAGEAALGYLRTRLPGTRLCAELHVKGADARLAELVARDPGDLVYVIAKRDPVARFVSSYNWDKHNMYLARPMRASFAALWERYTTVGALAEGLADGEEPARKLAAFGHMGMGQAFYTPPALLDALEGRAVFLHDNATLKDDLDRVVTALGGTPGAALPRNQRKTDYQAAYEDAQTMFDPTLSARGRAALEAWLADDIAVYRRLGG